MRKEHTRSGLASARPSAAALPAGSSARRRLRRLPARVLGGAVGVKIVGGIVGAYAGKEVAEDLNPTVEDTYWKENYRNRPYVMLGIAYEEYRPAYRYGWESRSSHAGRSFEEVEPDLERGWDKAGAGCKLPWNQAKPAVRDAWDRAKRP